MSTICYKCNSPVDLSAGNDIARTEDCESCHADLRCCKMCDFYDISSYNECREPTADRIVDKEKVNFCDHFKMTSCKTEKINNTNCALEAANALFKK